jgi:hypothetical protein
VLSAARVGPSQRSEHRHYSIARKFAAMRARIADERSNELQRRRLLRRTSAHNPVPLLIGEHREVLHRLHISPTGQRFPRAWDVDVPPGTLSAALEALTIARSCAGISDAGCGQSAGASAIIQAEAALVSSEEAAERARKRALEPTLSGKDIASARRDMEDFALVHQEPARECEEREKAEVEQAKEADRANYRERRWPR